MIKLVLVVGVVFALLMIVPNIQADHGSQTIGIITSLACQTMAQQNVSSTCPSYQELMETGLDTSLPGTGEFGWNDMGWYIRGIPQYKKVYNLYQFNDYHIIIDPPFEMAQRIKMITISTDVPVYKLAGEMKKENDIRILHQYRYVKDCYEAIITSDNWMELLADTIYYLRSDCRSTVFQTTLWIEDHQTEMNIETSAKFKHDKWVKESKEKCKEICKEY